MYFSLLLQKFLSCTSKIITMKKNLLLAVLLLTALMGQAIEFSSGYLTYSTGIGDTNWQGLYVTGLTNEGKNVDNLDLTIPCAVTYEGYTYRVVSIAANAFLNMTNIKRVTIKYGTTYIGTNSFKGCTSLTTVFLPSSLQDISVNAFSGCTSLGQVNYAGFDYPSGTVASSAFPGNSNMRLYISPLSVRSPEDYKARTGWTQFASVSRHKTACDVLSNNGYYAVGSNDILGASDWRSLTLLGIRSNADITDFQPLNAFSSNGMTFKVTKIGEAALSGESSLQSIDLSGCTQLTEIGERAFENCTSLISLTMPKQWVTIHAGIGEGCTSLTEFTVPEGSTAYSTYNGALYSYDQTRLLRVPEGKNQIAYPPQLLLVFDASHLNCKKLTYCHLPYGVRTIGSRAFSGTSNLLSVIIPSSVTMLSSDRVFQNSGTDGIAHGNYLWISCNMENPPTITASSYFGNNSQIYLCVPYGKQDVYEAAGWTGFKSVNQYGHQAEDILIYGSLGGTLCFTVTSTAPFTVNGKDYDGRVKLVCGGATCADDANHTIIDIPADVLSGGKTYAVTCIGEDACNNKTTDFTITGCLNVDTIGERAFYFQALSSFPFTNTLTHIDKGAFMGTKLTGEVKIPASVTSIGLQAFAEMTELSSLYFPGPKPETLGAGAWTNDIDNPDLTVWVPNEYAYQYLDAASEWGDFWTNQLAVWIKPTIATQMFSSVIPTDLAGSGITAYYAKSFNKTNTTQQLTLASVNKGAKNMGMLLTDLTVGNEYRIARPTGTVTSPRPNYFVGTASSEVNVAEQAIGYYWDAEATTPHFVKPTGEIFSPCGSGYLKLETILGAGISNIFTNLWPRQILRGDINDDGSVDVSDVNIVINIMLGKAQASSYPGNADLNDDGHVDVSDVNALINIMLGKE